MRLSDLKTTPSVLDRLIDLDPRSSTDSPRSRRSGVEELKQSVRRDVEWLLNSRRSIIDIEDESSELAASLACYGLPDFTLLNIRNSEEQESLSRTLERVIEVFEPRLIGVRVTLEPFSETDQQMTFRVEGAPPDSRT